MEIEFGHYSFLPLVTELVREEAFFLELEISQAFSELQRLCSPASPMWRRSLSSEAIEAAVTR